MDRSLERERTMSQQFEGAVGWMASWRNSELTTPIQLRLKNAVQSHFQLQLSVDKVLARAVISTSRLDT